MSEFLDSNNPEDVERVKQAISKWVIGKIMAVTLSKTDSISDHERENVKTVTEILDKAFDVLESRCDDKLKAMIAEARLIYQSDEMDFKSTHRPSNTSH